MKNTPIPFEYRLLRRKNQKHIRIRIDRNGIVVVSAPTHLAQALINKALHSKKEWVKKHLQIHREGIKRNNPLDRLTWEGQIYRVEKDSSTPRGRIKLDFLPGICVISNLPDQNQEKNIARVLKKRARPLLEKKLKTASDRTGIPYGTFYLRNQKSLWGSSSGKGNISLNWRVAMLPPHLQDYLIYHELAHQRHFNHSRTYWDELERIFPGSRRANGELKTWRALMDVFRNE